MQRYTSSFHKSEFVAGKNWKFGAVHVGLDGPGSWQALGRATDIRPTEKEIWSLNECRHLAGLGPLLGYLGFTRLKTRLSALGRDRGKMPSLCPAVGFRDFQILPQMRGAAFS